MSAISAYLKDQNVTLLGVLIYATVGLIAYFGLRWLLALILKKEARFTNILALAVGLFVLSLFLPSPLIHGQNTNFTTHFVGGGIFTGLIWLFIKQNIKPKLSPAAELASLYLLVSGLGVANELFEFFANGIGLLTIPGNDTWWDLFANTAGALTFWIVYRLFFADKP